MTGHPALKRKREKKISFADYFLIQTQILRTIKTSAVIKQVALLQLLNIQHNVSAYAAVN